MSENEKLVYVMILFPIFWPFIPVVLLCMACDAIKHRYWAWNLVDFKAKKRPTIQQAFPLGMDTPVEELALFYESSLGYVDTSPCEMIPYASPEGDGA